MYVAGMMAVQNQKKSYKKLYALLFAYFDLHNMAGKASPGSVILCCGLS